jgi:hypothetical protein
MARLCPFRDGFFSVWEDRKRELSPFQPDSSKTIILFTIIALPFRSINASNNPRNEKHETYSPGRTGHPFRKLIIFLQSQRDPRTGRKHSLFPLQGHALVLTAI